MRGTSQRSLDAVLDQVRPVLDAAGAETVALGEQLFAVLDAVDASSSLRRGLADPSRDAADKTGLVRGLLGERFDARVVDAVVALVCQRWTADADLATAVEALAVEATLTDAERREQLATVEDELFTITRSLIGSREARAALTEPGITPERRVGLLRAVLDGRGDAVTQALAERATLRPRGRRFVATLDWYGQIAATMRSRLIATVHSGTTLDAAQVARLESLLAQAYGRSIQLNLVHDTSLLAGLRIQVGDEVVDATVLTRLADARRRLAG